MKLSHALLALAAALPLAAFQEAVDPPPFSLTFPQGWNASVSNGLFQVNEPGTSANCNSYSTRMPTLAGQSQAELNRMLTDPWAVADWASVTSADASKMQLVSTTVRPIGAYQLRTAVVVFRPGAIPGQTVEVHAHIGISLKAGYAFNVGCYALPQHFPAARARMDAAVYSMRLG